MSAFQLEEFTTMIISNDPTVSPATSLEEHTLESFEQGYKAGWDDAVEALKQDQKKISSGFSRSLQEMSFTLEEARTQVMKSVAPLLEEMVHKVLPRLSLEGLPQVIINQVKEIAEAHTHINVEIQISPANKQALEHLLGSNPALDVTIVTEPSLAEGLAVIRFAESELKIDLGGVIQNFETALTQLYPVNNRDV